MRHTHAVTVSATYKKACKPLAVEHFVCILNSNALFIDQGRRSLDTLLQQLRNDLPQALLMFLEPDNDPSSGEVLEEPPIV